MSQFGYRTLGFGSYTRAVAGGAFPTIVSTAQSEEDSNVQLHNITLPSGLVNGNIIYAFGTWDTNIPSGTGWPAGWTQVFSVANGTSVLVECYQHTVDGGEGATVDVTTTGDSERSAHKTIQVSGGGTIETNTAQAQSTNRDPPSLTPTGGAQNYLWIEYCGANNSGTFTAASTDFTGFLENTTLHVCDGFATRLFNGTNQDPDNMSASGSTQWVAATCAVPPA